MSDIPICNRCEQPIDTAGHYIRQTIGQDDITICTNMSTKHNIRLDITQEEVDNLVFRASGELICEVCGRKYARHPLISNVTDFNDDPYLNFICTGEIVKL